MQLTIATPSPLSPKSRTIFALPLGLTPAYTSFSSIPTSRAIARAVGAASPVSIDTLMPMQVSARIAWADDGFGGSDRASASNGIGLSSRMTETKMTVRALSICVSANWLSDGGIAAEPEEFVDRA